MISLKEALEFTKDIPALSPIYTPEQTEQWFQYMDEQMDHFQIPNDLRLHVLLPKLDAEGQSMVYRSGLHDWKAAKRLLQRRATSSSCLASPLEYLDIVNFRMDGDEEPTEFAERLRQAAIEASSARGYEFPEGLLALCFIRGMTSKRLQRHLQERLTTSDLDELAVIATEWLNAHPKVRDRGRCGSRASASHCSGVSRAGMSLIDRAKYAINPEVLQDVLSMMKTMRMRQTVHDVRRLKLLCQPDLTPEERKNILETPDNDKARFRLHFETDIPFIFGLRFRVTRPWATWVVHAPKMGRWFMKKARGKPILTPGKWLAKILKWDIPTKEEQRRKALEDITSAVD